MMAPITDEMLDQAERALADDMNPSHRDDYLKLLPKWQREATPALQARIDGMLKAYHERRNDPTRFLGNPS